MRSEHRPFMKDSCRLLAMAALLTATGGGTTLAQADRPSLPLRGPIPFEALDLDGSGGISEQELERNRERVRCWMDLKLDSPEELTAWFGAQELLLEPETLDLPEEEAERLRKVTPDDVARVTRVGRLRGLRPAMSVLQWQATKGGEAAS